jgi:hypothetical protein
MNTRTSGWEQPKPVDLVRLTTLYKDNAVARAVLDEFAERTNDSSVTKLDRAIQIAEKRGIAASRADMTGVFRELEAAGCGQYLVGRRGHPSRFSWSVSLVSAGQAAAGENVRVEHVEPAEEVDEEGPSMLDHTFKLRPALAITVSLPGDLSVNESERLATFIKSLPFGR